MSVAVEFLGAAGTVTGSKHLLDLDGRRVLLDCGLYQGLKELRLRNWEPLPVPAASIDTVVLSHAHIDHSGYLPRLVAAGFRGDVLATAATRDVAGILLPDSGRLHEEEAGYHNERRTSKHTPALPLYTERQAIEAARRVRGVAFGALVAVGGGATVSFARAGHILGAATVAMEIGEGTARRRLVYSGDLGRYGAPILHDPAPVGEADYVLIESTYGDRRHGDVDVAERLAGAIRDGVRRGGAIVVPSFAVGRTQDLMYHLARLEDAGRIPRLPTFVDSPMAIDATGVYRRHAEEFDDDMRQMIGERGSPLQWTDVRAARTPAESRAINEVTGPAIIIAGSGMATGGRVLHHLRRRVADPRTTVLLVGYQAEGTRGRALQERAGSLRIFGDDVPVRAHVEVIDRLSAHADADDLVRWLRTASRPPRHVFVVHGEPGPARALAERIEWELAWPVSVPAYRDRVVLG
jgi:metallo-beta-lactamase family protein